MVYCFLANGFEEVEAIAPIDMLRRAGVEVKTVGVGGDVIDGRHGIKVIPDADVKDIILDDTLEAVILPGGLPGATNLEESTDVQKAIDFAVSNNKLVCAICAAPQILGHKGLLDGKEAIAYPGFEDELKGAIHPDGFSSSKALDNPLIIKGFGAFLCLKSDKKFTESSEQNPVFTLWVKGFFSEE